MKKDTPKILVILGPTASGKSDLAVHIAKKYNGEVISADSRQVYKGLNIGTGKITKKEMKGITHHMLDVISARNNFTVQEYKDQAQKIITEIINRKKLPIICGGTGFYIQALVDNISLPSVEPNFELRKNLEGKTVLELFSLLKDIDPIRAKSIDINNPRRLVRAIEIALTLGKVPPLETQPIYQALKIGITHDELELKARINKRLMTRIKIGMIKEAEKLHESGITWKRMLELGLEYRYLALYLTEKISKKEMLEKIKSETWHYAKRQKTWFKRDPTIQWFTLNDKKNIEQAIENFLLSVKN